MWVYHESRRLYLRRTLHSVTLCIQRSLYKGRVFDSISHRWWSNESGTNLTERFYVLKEFYVPIICIYQNRLLKLRSVLPHSCKVVWRGWLMLILRLILCISLIVLSDFLFTFYLTDPHQGTCHRSHYKHR